MFRIHSLWYIVAVLLAFQTHQNEGAKILAIFPSHARSHTILGEALMLELANRGHEITMISLFPQKEEIANYKDIVLKTSLLDFMGHNENNTLYNIKDAGKLEMARKMFTINQAVCDSQLQEEDVQKIIHSTDENFDLIIVEAFMNECFLGFVHKFKAPLVQVCSFAGTTWLGDMVGNPNYYSYVPDSFLTYSDKMNFWQRTGNTLIGVVIKFVRNNLYLPSQDAIMRKNFNDSNDLPSLYELEHQTSLILVNHHFSISYPKPLMPNLIQVGGLHLKPPNKLPKDLKKFLDGAKDGVIYFSMGSNLKSNEMPEATRNAFLEAFSKLKQQVLWKWETDVLPGQSSNLKLGKWFPQADILAHPNVRLFMTHGGLLSTQEALNRGVPVIGIPVFGDQRVNMAWAVSKGVGVLVDFDNVTTDSLSWALDEILQNPSYMEKVQQMSRVFRDQPLTPLEQAVFWTEYVIRHKGAPHMRSAALDLYWYQYFLLDVIVVVLLILGLFLSILFMTFRAIWRKIRKSTKPNKASDKERKKRD